MWIVRLALRRPYTFVVASLLIFIMGVVTIARMSTDIFPDVNIPVIAVAFNYTGMSPGDMENRIITPYERILTTTVNDIHHIESQSLYGVGVVKIYFQENANIENANAQVTAVSQTAIRQMPTGTQPPLVLEYNAASVPILQLLVSSDTLSEQALFDVAWTQLRTPLVVIPGVQIPYPYGGKQRQVMVDLDPEKLFAYGVSPADVSTAINNQNLILPAGTAKIGKQEYQIKLNSSPEQVKHLNDLPIKTTNGRTVFIRDVASVRDGFSVQTNAVQANGKAAVLISVLKAGGASTLDVVDNIKAALPGILDQVKGQDIKVTPLFDQSIFVRASVEGVIKEAAIAAGLTGLMILLFLGSWRSTLIVMISIPLSILVSIIILAALGQTLNVMTLGGMALAVGILVDDATVTIENIHRNMHMRKRLVVAILDGAQQIAVPAFVATLCICIVFVPVVFISGAAKYLFTPLAMAVVFAMATSYLLSRTLVPTLVHYLLAAEAEMYGGVVDESDPHAMAVKERIAHGEKSKLQKFLSSTVTRLVLIVGVALIVTVLMAIGPTRSWIFAHWAGLTQIVLCVVALALLVWLIGRLNLIWRVHDAFNDKFEKLQRYYGGLLAWALSHRKTVTAVFVTLVVVSCGLIFLVGTDFFPTVDAGQLRLHVRAPAGTRIEQTQRYFAEVTKTIRGIIPAKDVETVLSNIGIPNSSINLSLSDGSMMSPADGEILIALKEGHAPTADYQRELRKKLSAQFPNLTFFFAPADIVTQVLNFGLQSPIDVQIAGPLKNSAKNLEIARAIRNDVVKLPGVVDVRYQQVPITPDIRVNVDRTLASQVGVSQRDVASDMLISLSSSNQTAPNFWLSPANGVNYSIFVQTPQYKMDTINDLENTPVVPTGLAPTAQNTQLLGNLASTARGVSATNITHYNIAPTFDVLMGTQMTDLGSAADRIKNVVDNHKKDLPPGSTVAIRGQVQSMNDSFTGLGFGLIFAVVLVYLLMVINFQSWVDPLIILMALPGAMAGILWMLWATGTTISVPALMGSIMSIGVATANSILLITFANDQRREGMDAHDAALSAGLTRLRPVLMTALAMIIGMLPMALGFGEGGEQNAPLGRAVIGGLTLATFATLLFVPVVYATLRQKAPQLQVEKELQ